MVREFDGGASRNSDEGKLEYAGFNSSVVDLAYAKYMHKHRFLEDGTMRDSDNWKKGIPQKQYIKSLVRHTMDVWLENRGYKSRDGKIDAICGVLFNAQGWLFEELNKEE